MNQPGVIAPVRAYQWLGSAEEGVGKEGERAGGVARLHGHLPMGVECVGRGGRVKRRKVEEGSGERKVVVHILTTHDQTR